MTELCVDLGTARTIVLDRDKGQLLSAPSIVAYDGDRSRILCVGDAARDMEGRVGSRIRVVAPVRGGTIADFAGAQALVRRMIDRVAGARKLFARVIAVVPGCASEIERRAVEELFHGLAVRRVHLVAKGLASAWGATKGVDHDRARMIVDVGAGTTEIAVLSFGNVIAADSIRLGSDAFDAAIIEHVRARHQLRIGRPSAERLKLQLGGAGPREETDVPRMLTVCGNDLLHARPARREIERDLIADAMKEGIESILAAVDRVIKQLPPDVCVDVAVSGIVLAGGGAAIDGLSTLITERTGMSVTQAEQGDLCVVRGAALLPDQLRRSLVAAR